VEAGSLHSFWFNKEIIPGKPIEIAKLFNPLNRQPVQDVKYFLKQQLN
jgi:hypothetical protein